MPVDDIAPVVRLRSVEPDSAAIRIVAHFLPGKRNVRVCHRNKKIMLPGLFENVVDQRRSRAARTDDKQIFHIDLQNE